MGYLETRPVQSAVIPYALAGHDVLASAETGSGKTIAFVLPILQRLFNVPDQQLAGTRALILAPTRELAVQIEDTIQGLTYHTKITSAAVYGGVPMDPQDRALKAGVTIVVATPGRLMDHMRSATPDFTRLEVLVLDEADRMMDMGFWPDVQRIVGTLPTERQTLLFSATLPDEIMKLAKAIVRDAKHIQVGRAGGRRRRSRTRSRDAVEREGRSGSHGSCAACTARHWCSCAARAVQIAWRATLRGSASRRRRSTATARRASARRQWKGFAAESTPCSLPPISPRAGSTSTASRTS